MAGALQLESQAHWLRFAEQSVDALSDAGWHLQKSAKYRYDVVPVEDWYADIDEPAEAGNAWFELELGIVVAKKRVPLLPVLVQLIRSAPLEFDPSVLAAHGEADQMLAVLPDGERVALPWSRLKPILATLGELYFNDKIKARLRLSTLDAARLEELARGVELQWTGGERLRETGRKLSQFGAVKKVEAPAGLQATLRDYQLDGLAWMQFLREYDLGGILADDMGLGKTVQTLAHILVEKEAGRLTSPALVIAPTSLMANWHDEAARFAPSLHVLLLQGKERMESFDQIDGADIVLTTYALLPRDEEELRKHHYHLVILDESHYIKNTRSKAAQTAGSLDASHRLCLSGTPLENHLGELWSQFHFLMPGLLGDEKTFNTQFRHPIERQDDPVRRTLLNRRIRPFLLRRTKDNVAKELPPKTEMVRRIELSGAQRDLYETVRLAMDKKVRDEIDRKGVARSQIVILEALLKLRQVCCDPRLVKSMPSKKNTAAVSAKLTDLMQMVDDLLDEGRKILVFSQFTSMLALIEEELALRKHPVCPAHRRDARPRGAGGRIPAGRGADLPDQPEGGRRRPEPDGGRHRDPLRSVVESGGREPGHRPRLAHRAGQAGVRLQADRQGHAGRKDPAAAAEEVGAGALDPVRRRVAEDGADAGRSAGDLCAAGRVTGPGRPVSAAQAGAGIHKEMAGSQARHCCIDRRIRRNTLRLCLSA